MAKIVITLEDVPASPKASATVRLGIHKEISEEEAKKTETMAQALAIIAVGSIQLATDKARGTVRRDTNGI